MFLSGVVQVMEPAQKGGETRLFRCNVLNPKDELEEVIDNFFSLILLFTDCCLLKSVDHDSKYIVR